MAISSVQIANFALSKTGSDSTIESLTEGSAEAQSANLWFEHSRNQTLAAFKWSFATKRATLAAHAEDPPDDWNFRYVYPADCLQMRFIQNPAGKGADPIPFEIEIALNGTRSILTDAEEAIGIYTKDVTDTFLYPSYFIEIFATILASHIALDLTGSPTLANYLEDRARIMLVFASSVDASEKQEEKPRDADWIRGRTGEIRSGAGSGLTIGEVKRGQV